MLFCLQFKYVFSHILQTVNDYFFKIVLNTAKTTDNLPIEINNLTFLMFTSIYVDI